MVLFWLDVAAYAISTVVSIELPLDLKRSREDPERMEIDWEQACGQGGTSDE